MFKKNSKYKILTPNGFEDFDGINKDYKKTIKFVFSNNSTIRVTHDHLFGNVRATDIEIDDSIPWKNGNLEVVNIIRDNKVVDVYDPINVENHIYYGNDIINHNCEFLGSANTVIDAEKLKFLLEKTKNPIMVDLQGKFRIYEKPIEGAEYVLGVDTAKGTGEHYSTIQVLRIDSQAPVKMEQVAAFEDNFVDPYRFSQIVNRIAIYYNEAYIMVENNSIGWTVVTELHWNFENEGLVNSGSKSTALGVRAMPKTKQRAVILMKKFIEGNMLKLNDSETVKQLTDFVEKSNGAFRCENLNDDLVSGLYWACYLFKMNILDETMSFAKDENDESDAWGILSDIADSVESDWSWLNT